MEDILSENIHAELRAKKTQLHWLLQITKAINYNLSAPELFEIYKNVLRDHLKVGKLILFVFENQWKMILAYGADHLNLNFTSENDFHFNDPHNTSPKPPWASEFETIIPVFHNDKPLAYAYIDGYPKLKEHPKEILSFIHTITNIIVVAIENKRLMKESIRQAAVQKELDLAAEMQAMLLPAKLQGNNYFEIAATYLPHHEVGGDYYDYLKINEDESIICMADVSGKGLAAALLLSNFQANLHAVIHQFESLSGIMNALNAVVFKNAKGEKYITVFLARINHRTKLIKYINAGHNPPLLFYNKNFELLETGTTGLGMFEFLPFLNEGVVHFPEKAMLFCYTDGVTELENPEGACFGIEKFKESVSEYAEALTMELFHKGLIKTLNEFKKEAVFNDDVTLLSLRALKN